MIKGRALITVGLIVGSWTTMRIGMLNEVRDASDDEVIAAPKRAHRAEKRGAVRPTFANGSPRERFSKEIGLRKNDIRRTTRKARDQVQLGQLDLAPSVPLETQPTFPHAFVKAQQGKPPSVSAATIVEPVSKSRFRRPTGSAWLLIRNGSAGAALLSQGQLGGAQLGARVRYPALELNRSLNLGPALRVSSPLMGLGREMALGVSVARSGSVPFELIAERRIGLDAGTPNRWALLISGGSSNVALGRGVELDVFAQAGIVGLKTRSPFVGASALARKPIATTASAKVEIGVGIWGDAQQGVARIDAGPELSIRFTETSIPIRISAQWRQRLAGHALPTSGPALTVGTDF